MTYCERDCVAIDSKSLKHCSACACLGFGYSSLVFCYQSFLHYIHMSFLSLCLCGRLAWRGLLFTLVSCPSLFMIGIPFGRENQWNKAQNNVKSWTQRIQKSIGGVSVHPLGTDLRWSWEWQWWSEGNIKRELKRATESWDLQVTQSLVQIGWKWKSKNKKKGKLDQQNYRGVICEGTWTPYKRN